MGHYFITNQIAVVDKSDATLIWDNNKPGDARIEVHVAARSDRAGAALGKRVAWLETNSGPRLLAAKGTSDTCSVAEAAKALDVGFALFLGLLKDEKADL